MHCEKTDGQRVCTSILRNGEHRIFVHELGKEIIHFRVFMLPWKHEICELLRMNIFLDRRTLLKLAEAHGQAIAWEGGPPCRVVNIFTVRQKICRENIGESGCENTFVA